jgi:hypothetical protein
LDEARDKPGLLRPVAPLDARNLRVGKRREHALHPIRCRFAIGVGKEDDLAPARPSAAIASRRLVLVVLADEPDTEGVGNGSGAVL